MVKNTATSRKSKQPQKKPKTTPRTTVSLQKLDKDGLAYAKLLSDPCNAALVSPVYQGTGTGIITRFERDMIVNSSGTDIGSVIYFVPGGWSGSSASVASVWKSTAPITSDTVGVAVVKSAVDQPGYGFEGNVGSYRVLAACLQVTYVGSELYRAGVACIGQSTWMGSGVLNPSLSQLRSTAQHVGRVPDGTLEIIMRPNLASETFVDMQNTGVTSLWVDQPCMFASFSGMPVGTGMRVRMVSVVEWVPTTGPGIISRQIITQSDNTLNQVLRWLDNKMPGWDSKVLSATLTAFKALTLF